MIFYKNRTIGHEIPFIGILSLSFSFVSCWRCQGGWSACAFRLNKHLEEPLVSPSGPRGFWITARYTFPLFSGRLPYNRVALALQRLTHVPSLSISIPSFLYLGNSSGHEGAPLPRVFLPDTVHVPYKSTKGFPEPSWTPTLVRLRWNFCHTSYVSGLDLLLLGCLSCENSTRLINLAERLNKMTHFEKCPALEFELRFEIS